MPENAQNRLIEGLTAITGAAGIKADPADMAPFLTDWRGLWHGKARAVVRPANVTEVSQVLAYCRAHRVPVTVQGGNTGLVGGSVPGADERGIVLQTGRMTSLLEIDAKNMCLTAGAGVTLAHAEALAESKGLRIGVRLGSEGTAQIGGLVATNAGGSHAMRFGMMRARILGVQAVLPDGSIFDGLSGLRKNNFGPDLKQLFIGSEGAFGIVTAATLALAPMPGAIATALVALSSLPALPKLVATAHRNAGAALERIEFMSAEGIKMALAQLPKARCPLEPMPEWCALVEVAGRDTATAEETMMSILTEAFENDVALDAIPAANMSQAGVFWHLREAVVEGQRLLGPMLKHDVAVQPADLPGFIAAATQALAKDFADFPVNAFGHAGDGNVHFNVSTPDVDTSRDQKISTIVNDVVKAWSGTIAAEHGVGRLKQDAWAASLSPAAATLTRFLRRGLDPDAQFNPQIFPQSALTKALK